MFGKKNNKKYFLTYFILDDAFFVKEVIYNTLLQKPPRSDCKVFFEFEGDASLKSEFLNLLPSIRSDLLFLDVELSDGLVWDLIPQIKEALPNAYIVVMTDGLSPETQQHRHQFEEEVFTILEKPFQPGYLYSIIDKVINDLGDIDDTPDFLKEKTTVSINGTKSKMLSQLEETETLPADETLVEQVLTENEVSLFAEEHHSFDLEEASPFVSQSVVDEFEVEFDSIPSSVEGGNVVESTIEWNPSISQPVLELEEATNLFEETPSEPAIISQEISASVSLNKEVSNVSNLLDINFEENLSKEPSGVIHFDDNLSEEKTRNFFEDDLNHEINKEGIEFTSLPQTSPSTDEVEWSLDEVQPSYSQTDEISFEVNVQTQNTSSMNDVEWSLDEVQPSYSQTDEISFEVNVQTQNTSSMNDVEWSLDEVQPSYSQTDEISFEVNVQTQNTSSTDEIEWSLDEVQRSSSDLTINPDANANFEYKKESDLYNETISLNDDLMNSDSNDDFVITPPKQMYPSTVDRKTQRLNQVRNQNQWDQRNK